MGREHMTDDSTAERRAAAAVGNAALAMRQRALEATNPLFLRGARGQRECVASCVLLRLGPRVAVVTAGHALRTGLNFEFGAHSQILPISGDARRSLPPNDISGSCDRIDLVVVLLPMSIGEPTYLVIGYPVSRQRAHPKNQGNAAKAHTLLVPRRPLSDYAELGLDPMGNLLLRFDRKSVYRAGVPVTAPDPVGMSGGSAWLLPGFAEGHASTPRFVGVLTEWHKDRTRMIATRAHVAFQMLLELDPALRQWMLRLEFGNAT
jgi:hypothetical protein